MLVSIAMVSTPTPERYAKQLLSHLGRKVAIEPVPDRPEPAGRLVFAYGVGTVLPGTAALELRATAPDAESLERVRDVLARHLVRFGTRQELVVTWGPAADTEPSGTEPSGTEPSGTEPSGIEPSGTEPSGTEPSGTEPEPRTG